LIKKAVIHLALLVAPCLMAQDFQSRIDWINQEVDITITAPLDQTRTMLPLEKLDTEGEIAQNLPLYIAMSLEGMRIDSQNTFSTLSEEDPSLFTFMEELAAQAKRTRSRLLPDFTGVKVEYSLPFYPNLPRTFPLDKERPLPQAYIKWAPAADFTSLVIYVKKELPLYESLRTGEFQPSLYPKLLTHQGRILFHPEMMEAQYREQWGAAAYDVEYKQEGEHKERLGNKPLFTIAKELYGTLNTDLVLPERTVRALMQGDQREKILAQGRILFVLEGEPQGITD